jgi:lipopolysaccharide export LptBFGC system permease protein LptF
MTTKCRIILIALVVLAFAAVTAVCLHSLEEIHYLKSFFPATFTVQQAFYAGALELVKVAIIALPLVLLIGICLFFIRLRNNP